MPAERFFITGTLEGTIELEGNEFTHLSRVMRVRVGEEVELVNGEGDLAMALVKEIGKQSGKLEILSETHSPLPSLQVTLVIPIMRPSKLELVVEKCTELGAYSFCLYPADASEKETLSQHQEERLEQIAISAMKQCGRLWLPKIKIFKNLQEVFKETGPFLFGDTRKEAQAIRPQGSLFFITGPEKGFSQKELNLLDQKALGVQIHPNILRAETAPIAALCKLIC